MPDRPRPTQQPPQRRLRVVAPILALACLAASTVAPAQELAGANRLERAFQQLQAHGTGEFSAMLTRRPTPAMASGEGAIAGVGRREAPHRVTGAWLGRLVLADMPTGERIAAHLGRVAVERDGRWELRRHRLPSGSRIRYLPDLDLLGPLLLEAIQASMAQVRELHLPGRTDRYLLTTTIGGPAAHELVVAGILPAPEDLGGWPGTGFDEHGPRIERTVFRIDLAFFVDRTTGDLLQLRAQVHGVVAKDHERPSQEHAAASLAPFALNEDGAPRWDNGLPLRHWSDSQTWARLELSFAQLGETVEPGVDARGLRLLGVR